jgi:hypothetical protein
MLSNEEEQRDDGKNMLMAASAGTEEWSGGSVVRVYFGGRRNATRRNVARKQVIVLGSEDAAHASEVVVLHFGFELRCRRSVGCLVVCWERESVVKVSEMFRDCCSRFPPT